MLFATKIKDFFGGNTNLQTKYTKSNNRNYCYRGGKG
jgi:hypothetical protein